MLKGFRISIYIIMYLVLVALTGVLNVVVFKEFDWQSFLNVEFWIPVAINNAFYFSAFVITVMLVYDILEYKDKKFREMEEDIVDERDKLVTDDFKQHIINRNFYEKRNVWFQLVNIWLSNLQSKLRHKTAFVMRTRHHDNWTRRALRYERRKEILNEFKTKTWVDNNLIFRKRLGWGKLGWLKRLHYPEITVNEIIYGTVSLRPKKSELSRHILRGQIVKKSVTMIVSIVLSVVANILQVERFMSTLSIFIALAIMFFTILINVGVGVFAGFKAHKERVNNATVRLGFVLDYIDPKGKRYPQAPMIDYEPEKVKEKDKVVDDKKIDQPKNDLVDLPNIEVANKQKEPILT